MQSKVELIKRVEKINWFPGHMFRALRLVNEFTSNIDIFLEVRDARVPISSRNDEFDKLISQHNKNRIIIFNKFDLCNKRITLKLIDAYNEAGIKCYAVSATEGIKMRDILKDFQDNNKIKFKSIGQWMLICGMPNVGKSTIINQLRQISPELHSKKAMAKSTKTPCTTKNLQGIKIIDNDTNRFYLVDSPGVMIPQLKDQETALKLSVIGCIKDAIPQKEPIVDFLLEQLNKQKVQKYIHFYGMKEQSKDCQEFFHHIRDKYFHYNYENAMDKILIQFREGKLGNITLDDLSELGLK